MKLSGDIGAAIALKGDGGTTCGVTLIVAALAGIKGATQHHILRNMF